MVTTLFFTMSRKYVYVLLAGIAVVILLAGHLYTNLADFQCETLLLSLIAILKH